MSKIERFSKLNVGSLNLKIGIDARLLSRQLSGISRYTLEMCIALNQIQGVSLFLYSPAPILNKWLHKLKGATVRTKNFEMGFLRQLWGESYLPWWANQDKVDVFWAPAHRLPRLLPRNIAKVVTVHDLVWKYASDTMRPLSRLLERLQMPLAVYAADLVVTDAQSTTLAITEEFSIDSEKLTVIPLGVSASVNTSSIEALHNIGINKSYFLFVGTHEPRKNLIRLLAAYSSMTDTIKNSTMFVIAGGKGWGIEISNTIAELGLHNHVIMLGYVDDSMLATLYANAQFLAMPSLYEGFGLPLIEAMQYGTPVLTSNNSSMPEVTGDAGFLVDALNVDSILHGLTEMITNEKLRSKYALNAKINAAQYNWDNSARQMIDVFKKAISIKSSSLS